MKRSEQFVKQRQPSANMDNFPEILHAAGTQERLEAGADRDPDIDDLQISDLVEEEPPTKELPKKVTIKEPPPAAAVPTAPLSKIKLKQVLHYVKTILLVVIWCIFTVCIMLNKEKVLKPRLLTITASAPKDFLIPKTLQVQDKLEVFIKAAYDYSTKRFRIANGAAPLISSSVQRICYDEKGIEEIVDVSEVWMQEIAIPEKLDRVHATTRNFLFKLFQNVSAARCDDALQLHFETTSTEDVPIKLSLNDKPINKDHGIIYGAIVLLFLYVMIIWEIINRTFASIIAATLSIGILATMHARPSLTTIMTWIDCETLLLLFGMMILVAILSESGVFDYLAVYAYQITKGHIWPLINCLCLFTALLSAFLDNVTMMLLVTPVIIRLCEVLELDPVPIIMCMVIFSNIGAATTPVGDPPNVIITTNRYIAEHDVHFVNFFYHMLPGVLLAMIVAYLQLRLKYRHIDDLRIKVQKDLHQEIHAWERVAASIGAYSKDEDIVRDTLMKKVDKLKIQMEEEEEAEAAAPSVPSPTQTYEQTLQELKAAYPIRNKLLLIKSLVVFTLVIFAFVLHSVPNLHHLSLGWASLIGALMLLILADVDDIDAILGRVEWSTLIFFSALFVLMEALSLLGLIEVLGNFVVNIIKNVSPEYRLMVAILIILWVSAIGSAFLANIPVTTMLVRIIITLSENEDLDLPLQPMVWALAFGACFGGNGTLIGASANVVSAGVAEQHGYKFTFIGFFIVGFPVMLVSVVVATFYLLLAHWVFEWHTE